MIKKKTAKRAKRTRAPQQRAADTQRNILDIAIKHFAKFGYEATSTRTVARDAGIQHGLVAYHFGGKEGLWRAVIKDLLAAYRERFQAHLTELADADAVTRLRALQEEVIQFSPLGMDFHRIMSHVARSSNPQLKWIVKEYLREVYDLRADLIRQAQRAGKYVQGDPYHLQYVFLGAVMMAFLLAPEVEELTGQNVNTAEFVEQHKRLCLSLFFRDKT